MSDSGGSHVARQPMAQTLRAAVMALCCLAVAGAEGGESANLLRNPSFEEAIDARGVPAGWSLYAGGSAALHLKAVGTAGSGRRAILIQDDDPTREIGLTQIVAGAPGETYEASARVRGVAGASSFGAYLQLRFHPSNKYAQVPLLVASAEKFHTVRVKATAPPGTTSVRVYLYTHRAPTPRLIVDSIRLVSGVPPPPPPPPPPVPPVYTKLKELHLTTHLVKGGKPAATIVVPRSGIYAREAEQIREAIRKLTGVDLPVTNDDSREARVPIAGNLIALGNRSTNRTIGQLYDRFYTLLDLKYPGPGGHVVRTLHSPFGDGRNVVLVGGSDANGIAAATRVLIGKLSAAGAKPGALAVGRLAEIKLGEGLVVPKDIRDARIWEASAGYRSVGYFGWNSLSKRMALYHMTGDPFHAREFLRLAFPDAKARKEIAAVDGERIENKDEPLSGPYHYNAHLMILFWDLIEESPVFSDEERLRVTNAFAKQLNHRKGEGIYRLRGPSPRVGSRHGQWSAISLYCLGRYFQKDYPSPLWQQCMDGATHHFASLHRYAWVGGESDNLFWYNAGIAPILTWLVLTGDRAPVENGVLAALLRGQEALISGRVPDWALRSASVGFLHKAAYLTQDGRWISYRERTGVDTGIFRLGQSFWPEERLVPKPPADLVGTWSVHALSEPMWQARRNGFPLEQSFQFASFRSAADASGDFVLIDGYNGASRNPYHTFAILELRIGGHTLLQGYRNQLLTRVDGLVEPKIAMNAALRHRSVVGPTAIAVAEVPDAPYCTWRRTLVHRTGRYALVVDDLAFRTDSENVEVEVKWETPRASRRLAAGALRLGAAGPPAAKPFYLALSEPAETTTRGRVATMRWLGPAKKGQRRLFFSLIAKGPAHAEVGPACLRVAANAAALALPTPALAVAGEHGDANGELVVLANDHLFGTGLRRAGGLLATEAPVDIDWDFPAGRLHVVAHKRTVLNLALASGANVRLDGNPIALPQEEIGVFVLALEAGRHVVEGLRPSPARLDKLAARLRPLLAEGQEARAKQAPGVGTEPPAKAAPLRPAFTANVGGPVVDLITIPSEGGRLVCAAEGKTIHLLSAAAGESVGVLRADGATRMVRWWPEHELLLAGCADEKVIAFDREGRRRWAFTSEMDPAVLRAAKTYWFKSARGHEGIHGLTTGVLLKGESQAFVGSACTLEILDEHGKLVKRMPQFWGKVSTFAFVDNPDGSIGLLAARKYNGTNRVAIINNRTLNPSPRGFHTVPPGHSYVGGWSSMNRHHLFVDDLDGDGTKEVCSETNGTWNRVTVWTTTGKALHDASFGPGDRIPALNMRDIDIADLDGDGKKEIVVGTSSGLIVTLDWQCRKRWARRLASPPTVLKGFPAKKGGRSRIVVGCEDGTVLALDGKGQIIASGKVRGRPTCIGAVASQRGRAVVVLATRKGEVAGLRLPE